MSRDGSLPEEALDESRLAAAAALQEAATPGAGDPLASADPPRPPRSRGMADAVASSGLTLVVGLLSAVVISRLYGVVVVGEYALVAAPFALVSFFSNLNEHQALIRGLAGESPASTRAASLLVVQTGFSTALTVLVAAVGAPLTALLLQATGHPGLVRPALVLVAAYVVLGNLAWNCDTFQIAFRGTRVLLVVRFVDVALLLALSVLLAVLRAPDTASLVLAQVLTMAVALLLRVVLLARLLSGRPTRQGLRAAAAELRGFVRFGLRLVPGSAAHVVTVQAGTWIVGAVRPLAVLGAYSRANNLANRLVEVGYRLGEVLLPVLSAAVLAGDVAEAERRFARWRLPVVLVLAGGSAALAGAAEGVLEVFGPGFAAAAVPMALLVPAYACGVVTYMQAQLLVALGAPGTVSRLVLLRAALALGSIGPLTVWQGATGAAAALLLGHLAELVGAVRAGERRLRAAGVRPVPLPWGPLLGATVLALATARVLDLLLDGVLGGLVAAAAGLLVHAAVLGACGLVPLTALRTRLRR